MGTISSNDILYATLSRGGNMLVSHTLTGVNSIGAVVGKMRRYAAGAKFGIYILELRNSTAGWCHRQPLAFTADV